MGCYPVGSFERAPLTPPPRFPGAREAGTGWGTQGALCRGGGKRVCQPGGGAGWRRKRGAADSQRRLVRLRPPSASGRRRLGSLLSSPAAPRAPGRPGAVPVRGGSPGAERPGLLRPCSPRGGLSSLSNPVSLRSSNELRRPPHLPAGSLATWASGFPDLLPPPPVFISLDLIACVCRAVQSLAVSVPTPGPSASPVTTCPPPAPPLAAVG